MHLFYYFIYVCVNGEEKFRQARIRAPAPPGADEAGGRMRSARFFTPQQKRRREKAFGASRVRYKQGRMFCRK